MQNIITAFSKSKWIWCDKNCGENEYAEFIEQIIWEGSPLRIWNANQLVDIAVE